MIFPVSTTPSPIHIVTNRSINWSENLPSYSWSSIRDHLHFHLPPIIWYIFAILFFIFILFLLALWIFRYFSMKKQLKQCSILLEIKPPSISLQSAFSTKQLFTILHSLGHNFSFIEKLLKVKKRMSYELVSTKEDGIRYILCVPEEDVPIVTKNIRSYLPGVLINQIQDYLSQTFEELQSKEYTIADLKLTHPYPLPLQDQDVLTKYDPIAYITGQMTKLDSDELISLQFITNPINSTFHQGVLNHIHDLRKRMHEAKEIESTMKNDTLDTWVKVAKFILLGIFTIAWEIVKALNEWLLDKMVPKKRQYGYQAPVIQQIKSLTPRQIHLQNLVGSKIDQSLYETTIRLFITGSKKDNILSRKIGIISTLSTFRNPGYQSLKAISSFPIKHRLITQYNYLKLKHRLLSFSLNPILSISEMSSLYHFPFSTTTDTEDLQDVKSLQLPAPLSLKNANGSLDIVFATNIHGETITPIGLTKGQRRTHTYITGMTGSGKSTLMLNMIYQDVINGKGIAILDPHGDLVERILGIIPKERIKDVVYINPHDIKHAVSINLLELPEGLSDIEKQQEKELIISNIISIFRKLYPDTMGYRMENVLRNALFTVFELESPTFLMLNKLLTDPILRKKAKDKLKDEVVIDYWKNVFEKLNQTQKNDVTGPITNKLGEFMTSITIREIINKEKSTINFEDIMNSGKILICNLSMGKTGEDLQAFLGGLIIAKIQLAALKRVTIPEDERKDFYLYIDEFQHFATSAFAQIFSEARKYHLDTILAHQSTSQIDDNLLETIIGNSGTIIAFRTNSPKSQQKLQSFFAPKIQKEQLGNISLYTFYIKVNAVEAQEPFSGVVDKFTVENDENIRKAVIEYSRQTYGTKTPKETEESSIKVKTIESKKETASDTETSNEFEEIDDAKKK